MYLDEILEIFLRIYRIENRNEKMLRVVPAWATGAGGTLAPLPRTLLPPTVAPLPEGVSGLLRLQKKAAAQPSPLPRRLYGGRGRLRPHGGGGWVPQIRDARPNLVATQLGVRICVGGGWCCLNSRQLQMRRREGRRRRQSMRRGTG